MKPPRKSKKVPSAESIARLADWGENVSRFFTNRGKMMCAGAAGLAKKAKPPIREAG